MPQTAHSVLMIRPAHFGSNPETAPSNAFQHLEALPDRIAHGAALQEFDRVVATLRAAGVDVRVADDEPEPPRPDAIFPNNWFSTHDDGTVVLYVNDLGHLRRIIDRLKRVEGIYGVYRREE